MLLQLFFSAQASDAFTVDGRVPAVADATRLPGCLLEVALNRRQRKYFTNLIFFYLDAAVPTLDFAVWPRDPAVPVEARLRAVLGFEPAVGALPVVVGARELGRVPGLLFVGPFIADF